MSTTTPWVLCSCGHAMRTSGLRTHLKGCKRPLEECRILSTQLSHDKWKANQCLSPECTELVNRKKTPSVFCSPSCQHYVRANFATEQAPTLPPTIERDYAAEAVRAEEARMAKYNANRGLEERMIDGLPAPLMGDALVAATRALLRPAC